MTAPVAAAPRPVISHGLPGQPPDIDPARTEHLLDHVKPEVVAEAVRRYRLDDPALVPTGVCRGRRMRRAER